MLRCYGDSKGWNTASVSYLAATSAAGDGPSRDRKKDRLAVSRYSSIDVPDTRGLTMECMCMACGGSGFAQHVDRTLPPPPCRVCRPEEAALHMALARETRTVVAARRRDAYQMLRAAIVLVPIPYNKPIALVAGQPISGAADAALVARERAVAATQAQQQGAGPG